MRIALIGTPWYAVPPTGYGGIEQVVALLADGLVDRGHDVTLITAGGHRTRAQTVLTSYADPQGARIGEALPEVVHAAFVQSVLRDRDVDLVHDHSTAGPLLASSWRCPTVVTAHNDVSGEFGQVLRLLGSSVAPVAISRAQSRNAPDLAWAGVVPNGIDTAGYAFRAQKDETGFVLFLGRISPAKAPHAAIDAARAVGRPIVLAAKCVEKVERDYFTAQIAPRLGSDVQWLGEVDAARKAELLASASALVFPIAWPEPFGLVMLEAMAAGTPVVALRRGAVEEVVEDGVSGWVCDSQDELVAKLRRVGELDPAACRRHVEQRFSPAAMVRGYEQVYARVLASRRVIGPRRPDSVIDLTTTVPS